MSAPPSSLGPLTDPAADRPEFDASRLADLRTIGGEALVVKLLRHFHAHLTEMLPAWEEGPAWSADSLHRTVGVAGILGFEALEALCREREEALSSDPALILRIREVGARALIVIDRRLLEIARNPQNAGQDRPGSAQPWNG